MAAFHYEHQRELRQYHQMTRTCRSSV